MFDSLFHPDRPSFRPLEGIYEPSAVQQLADGRFLVVEDEREHPFSLFRLQDNGDIDSEALTPGFFQQWRSFWQLDDLEGLSMDRQGRLYAITSHSRDGDGDKQTARCKLVRFRVEEEDVEDTAVVDDVLEALTQSHPLLAAAAKVKDVKEEGGLNIEALEMRHDRDELLLGLRSPLLDGLALIASLTNPDGVFDEDEDPRIAPRLITLNLGGDGIRGLGYVASLKGYLIISGPVAKESGGFKLWFWDGAEDSDARPVAVPGLSSFAHGEGVCSAHLKGRDHILLVSDDGNRKRERPAHYLLLEPQQLQIDR